MNKSLGLWVVLLVLNAVCLYGNYTSSGVNLFTMISAVGVVVSIVMLVKVSS